MKRHVGIGSSADCVKLSDWESNCGPTRSTPFELDPARTWLETITQSCGRYTFQNANAAWPPRTRTGQPGGVAGPETTYSGPRASLGGVSGTIGCAIRSVFRRFTQAIATEGASIAVSGAIAQGLTELAGSVSAEGATHITI